MSKDKGYFMKRFYRVSNSIFMEIDFVDTICEWQAYLIDINVNKIISTIINTDKIKLIANIVSNNWFSSNSDNFGLFIEDILKY